MSNDIIQLRKMLDALLRSEGLVEWVGGYVYGATSNGDPFVILYPASDKLNEKVCRVYPHDFKKLPDFIPTGDIVGDTDNNPSKDKAQRAGIYHTCPPFKIVMHLGKDTQMGREKRFSDVLYISNRQPEQQPAPSTPQQPSRQTAPAVNGSGRQQAPPPTEPPKQQPQTTAPEQPALNARGLTEFALAAADIVGAETGEVVKFMVAMFSGTDYWPFDAAHNKRYLNAVVDGMTDRIATG